MAKAKSTLPTDEELDWRDDDDIRTEAGIIAGIGKDEVRRVADTDHGPVIETTSGRRYVHAVTPDGEGKTGLLMVNPPVPKAIPPADPLPATMLVDGRTVFRASGFPVYVGPTGVDIDEHPEGDREDAMNAGASDDLAERGAAGATTAEHVAEPDTETRARRK